MFTLVTGLPGNGKTLFTIHTVKRLAEKEGRPVYYHGIPELTLPWLRLDDPTKWHEVPPGSIVVIDEVQQLMPNRAASVKVPPHVEKIATHRHLGIDLFFITQHPQLIDPMARKLAGEHLHLVRVWGGLKSTVHRWNAVRDDCDKRRTDSERSTWSYDKSLFGVYKSAEAHTHKRRLPFKWWLAYVILPAVILAGVARLVWSGGQWFGMWGNSPAPSGQVAPGGLPGPASSPAGLVAMVPGQLETSEWFARQQPRVPGLPHTAPVYDQVMEPQNAPVPAGCVQTKTECRCYTDQGTVVAVTADLCGRIVQAGYFDARKPPAWQAGDKVSPADRPVRSDQPRTGSAEPPAPAQPVSIGPVGSSRGADLPPARS